MKRVLIGLLLTVFAVAQVVPRPAAPLNLLLPCKGKVTLLAFVVTTCPHCQAFTRDVMEPLHESGKVCAIALAFNQDGDIAHFAALGGLRFPVYKIERSAVREFLGMTGPDRPIGTPQVVVIDKRGMIQAQSKPEGSPILLQSNVVREIVRGLQ